MIGSSWVRARFPCSCSLCTVTSVPLVGVGVVVRAPVASHFTRGLHVSLERGKSMSKGLGAPVLSLQGSGEAEIAARRGARVGHFDDVMGLGRSRNCHSRHLSHPRPFRKARAERRLAFGIERLTCCQRLWQVSFAKAPMMGL
jgi:hypothetical protein